MDAELEVVDGELVVEGDLTPVLADGKSRVLDRVRSVAASPRVQGAAAATAGFVAGAATLALLRRAGAAPAPGPGPGGAVGPAGPSGPRIMPLPVYAGTYVVHVRVLNPRPPL
jgi:hypothetical protein